MVVGTVSANRDQREIEPLIGFFVNTLAVRMDMSSAPSVGQWLAQARQQTLAAQANQDLPFERIVEIVQPARSLAHGPIFQVAFLWQNGQEKAAPMGGLDVGPAPRAEHVTAKFDLMLALTRTNRHRRRPRVRRRSCSMRRPSNASARTGAPCSRRWSPTTRPW